jgi:hypothetical protein
MKNVLRLSVLVILLASIGLAIGNQLTHSIDLGLSNPSVQIDKSSVDSLGTTCSIASDEKCLLVHQIQQIPLFRLQMGKENLA